jgi:hypothetical protein
MLKLHAYDLVDVSDDAAATLPWYSLNRGLGGPQGSSRHCGEERRPKSSVKKLQSVALRKSFSSQFGYILLVNILSCVLRVPHKYHSERISGAQVTVPDHDMQI